MVSKTTLYYRSHPEARKKKLKYDTKYESTEERREYRSKLGQERYKRKLKGNQKDLSHTKSGKLVLESRKLNRARNGSNGHSTLK